MTVSLPRRSLLASAVAAPWLAGCAGPGPSDYAAERPTLDLKAYFNGLVLAHGMVADRGGRVRRRFSVRMDCSWRGAEGVLDEAFTYTDGTRERRIWRITDQGGGRYVGRADDVVGEAQGIASGNALNWRYTLKLPIDGRIIEIDFDDWMFLIDERVMLNKAVMSKWGVRVGEVLLSFTRG